SNELPRSRGPAGTQSQTCPSQAGPLSDTHTPSLPQVHHSTAMPSAFILFTPRPRRHLPSLSHYIKTCHPEKISVCVCVCVLCVCVCVRVCVCVCGCDGGSTRLNTRNTCN